MKKPRAAAGFSPCGRYRYWLTRTWSESRPVLLWIMLNPSTADAFQDDPTVRRCVGFATRWGYGGILVANLFAYRATDPRVLLRVKDPVGPDNDAILCSCALDGHVVAAWGNRGSLLGRAGAIVRLLAGSRIDCLGITSQGHPLHPLYLPSKSVLQLYSGVGREA